MKYRYRYRTAKAIDALGGGVRIMREMKRRKYCTNPLRTFETWLERKKISPGGQVFLWKVAFEKKISITPHDFEIVERR